MTIGITVYTRREWCMVGIQSTTLYRVYIHVVSGVAPTKGMFLAVDCINDSTFLGLDHMYSSRSYMY